MEVQLSGKIDDVKVPTKIKIHSDGALIVVSNLRLQYVYACVTELAIVNQINLAENNLKPFDRNTKFIFAFVGKSPDNH